MPGGEQGVVLPAEQSDIGWLGLRYRQKSLQQENVYSASRGRSSVAPTPTPAQQGVTPSGYEGRDARAQDVVEGRFRPR